ncbi:Peptidylprolyl isomerase B [Mycena chlorophos]|uniref:Peptidylprolyl isomerase B n=1 Tax=Mycena chlorophos TaxID=658473 RepID=A0A8H6SWQ2_MYCCL|nr:Peptidylprolyl isomerase B [Mycena chlorophos]
MRVPYDDDGEVDQLEDDDVAESMPPSARHPSLQGNAGGLAATSGISKRYRSAPAKTFTCTGYGQCRMVFSRSEHLARHIRKHTGERPFRCHCGKQFSRLDNLRQHAQSVHADVPERNNQLIKELQNLHARIGANLANGGGAEGETNSTHIAAAPSRRASLKRPSTGTKERQVVKQERESPPAAPGFAFGFPSTSTHPSVAAARPRPITSAGYEGAIPMDVDGAESKDADSDEEDESTPRPKHRLRPSPGASARAHPYQRPPESARPSTSAGYEYGYEERPTTSHGYGRNGSLRGPSAPTRRSPLSDAPSPPSFAFGAATRPFTSPTNSFDGSSPFAMPMPSDAVRPGTSGGRPGTSSGRPGTSNGAGSSSRPTTSGGPRLPPLSAMVSPAALGFRPSSSSGHYRNPTNVDSPLSPQFGKMLPPALQRPSTSEAQHGQGEEDWDSSIWRRRGASFGRPGTAPGKFAVAAAAAGWDGWSGETLPPIQATPPAADDSPFSFSVPDSQPAHGPVLPQPPSSSHYSTPSRFAFGLGDAGAGASPPGNSRKRSYGGPDGPLSAYEYGSESRPPSRRLSVMDLVNDDQRERPSTQGYGYKRQQQGQWEHEEQRPTTTSGLIMRASAMVLHDPDDSPSSERQPRVGSPPSGASAAAGSPEQQDDEGTPIARLRGQPARSAPVSPGNVLPPMRTPSPVGAARSSGLPGIASLGAWTGVSQSVVGLNDAPAGVPLSPLPLPLPIPLRRG